MHKFRGVNSGGKTLVIGAGACVLALGLSSCGSAGIYSVTLPGGADLGSDPMTVSLQFDDVLDLVPQSAVKVDGVAVGRVTSIEVPNGGWTANVDIALDSAVNLPGNAIASIKQTNLLGAQMRSPSR